MGFHYIPKPPRIVALGGPVTAAIRAMRADEPATDYARIRELRRAIADRIEADIALLDALDPFADEREADQVIHELDALGQICAVGRSADDEGTDDNGLADHGGEHEQRYRDVLVAL